MKNFIYFLLAIGFILIFLSMDLNGQNSTCQNPSGPMQQPGDSIPTCFPGFGQPNSGPLTQFYSFVATSTTMTVQLTPIIGTSCSFPNTAINYSNLRLFQQGNCNSPVATGSVFNNLMIGQTYIFGLTMTPADPGCIWIADACPKVLEFQPPLDAEAVFFSANQVDNHVRLEWDFEKIIKATNITVYRYLPGENSPTAIAGLSIRESTIPVVFEDIHPANGKLSYFIEIQMEDGSLIRSETVSILIEGLPEFAIVPTMVNDNAEFIYYGDENHMIFSIHDPSGRRYLKMDGNENEINEKLAGLVPVLGKGIYLATLQVNGRVYTSRIIKV